MYAIGYDGAQRWKVYKVTGPEDSAQWKGSWTTINSIKEIAEAFDIFDLTDIADSLNIFATGDKYDMAGTIFAGLEAKAAIRKEPRKKVKHGIEG